MIEKVANRCSMTRIVFCNISHLSFVSRAENGDENTNKVTDNSVRKIFT